MLLQGGVCVAHPLHALIQDVEDGMDVPRVQCRIQGIELGIRQWQQSLLRGQIFHLFWIQHISVGKGGVEKLRLLIRVE